MENIKILENKEKNGIEIYFNTMPTREIISNLKAGNFRWHSGKKCWYSKATATAKALIENLGGTTSITANTENRKQEIPQSIYKYNFKGIKTPNNEYIKCRYNLNETTYVLCVSLDTYSLLKETPQGTYQHNESDIYTDYFETTCLYIEPKSKEYLNALQGYIKSLEHNEKISARCKYKIYTKEEEQERKEKALALINKARELAMNYLTLDFEKAEEIYNTLVNENEKQAEEKREQEKREETKNYIKRLQEQKQEIEQGKHTYYEKIIENEDSITAISKNEHYIIDFTPNCLNDKKVDYTIIKIDKNNLTRESKTLTAEEYGKFLQEIA